MEETKKEIYEEQQIEEAETAIQSEENGVATEPKRKKKPIKLLIIGGALIVVLIAAIVLCPLILKEAKYKKALDLINNKNYQAAYDIFEELGDYKDSEEQLKRFRYALVEVISVDAETGEKATIEEYIFNENGLLEKYFQGTDVVRNCTYDENGKLIKDVYLHGDDLITIDYSYDKNGNLTKKLSTIPGGGHRTQTYEYDKNGNLIKESDIRSSEWYSSIYPDSAYVEIGWNETIEYSYDKNGNLIKKTTESETIEYEYNSSGKLIQETETNSRGITTINVYKYDSWGKLESIFYDIEGDQYITEYEYDNKGNVIKVIKVVSGYLNGHIFITEKTYDKNGNVIKTAFWSEEDGEIIDYEYYEYTYDENNNLIKEIHTGRDGVKTYGVEFKYEFVYIPYDLTDEEYYKMIAVDSMVQWYIAKTYYYPGFFS